MNHNEELLTLTQVAIRAGVTPSAVSNWRKRYPDFPQSADGEKFSEREIYAWLESRGKAPTDGGDDSAPSIQAAVNAMRGSLGPEQSVAAIATLVTLSALGADMFPPGLDLGRLAESQEAEHGLPKGCLTEPLKPLLSPEFEPLGERSRLAVIAATQTASAAEIFDALLSWAGGGRGTADSLTSNRAIETLCAFLPEEATSILDPACGFGGLLLTAAESVGAARLAGYEVNRLAWALCVQRLLLHGRSVAEVYSEDALAATPTGFEVVVAHPPFGMRIDPASRAGMLLRGIGTSSSSGELAWLLTARNALSEGGTAVVLTTASSTFQRAGAPLRHELVRSGSVRAIISLLAPALALPSTSVGATIWVLGSPTTDAKPVLMVNGGEAGDTDAVIEVFQNWREDPQHFESVPGFSITVPVLDLLVGVVDLNPAVATAVPIDPDEALSKATSVLDTLSGSIEDLASLPPTPKLHLLSGSTPLVNLTDVAKVIRPLHVRREDLAEEGTYLYVTGVKDDQLRIVGRLKEAPQKAVITQPGDVVLATTGQVSAAVDVVGGHVLGSSVWLVRPKGPFAEHPHVLALLLNSARIQGQTSGTTVQRLRSPRDVTVACPDPFTLTALQEWVGATRQVRSLATAYLEAASEAEKAIADALDSGATSHRAVAR